FLFEPTISIEENDGNAVLIYNGNINGSGVLINNQYVLTVKHVAIKENDFMIEFKDGSKIAADLAVLPEGETLSVTPGDMENIGQDLMILKLKTPYTGPLTTRFKCDIPSLGEN